MDRTEQTQTQADAAQLAAQQAAVAKSELAQTQLQATIDKAVQEALKSGRISTDAKNNLRDEIRSTIDAAREATQQGLPVPPPPPGEFTFSTGSPVNNDIPPQVPEILGIMGITLVCCIVGYPLARAIARWIDRRGTTPPAPSREITQRLEAIEQAVESVAVEVERISEGQRFTARVLSERTHEPAPEFVPARDPVAVSTPANARRS